MDGMEGLYINYPPKTFLEAEHERVNVTGLTSLVYRHRFIVTDDGRENLQLRQCEVIGGFHRPRYTLPLQSRHVTVAGGHWLALPPHTLSPRNVGKRRSRSFGSIHSISAEPRSRAACIMTLAAVAKYVCNYM